MYKVIWLIVFFGFSSVYTQSLYIPDNGGMARISALGANPFITDPENIRNNPAWGSYYKNSIWLNYGTQSYSGQHAGLNVAVSNNLTIGGFFNRNCSPSIYSLVIDNLNSYHLFTDLLSTNYEIFSSFMPAEMISVGLGLAAADINQPSNNNKQYGINMGTVIKVIDGFYVDAAANVNLPYTMYLIDVKYVISRVSLNLRGFCLLNQYFTLVFQFNHNKLNEDYSTPYYTANHYFSGSDFAAGIMYKNELCMIAGGVGHGTEKSEYVKDIHYTNLNLGAELYIWNIFIPRIGYNGKYYSGFMPGLKADNLDAGLGIKVSKFQLDGYYSYDFKEKNPSKYNGVYFSLSYKN